MPTSPNMDLIEPDVSITPGPEWAQMLNTLIDLIDSHDHTTGKGVPITQVGLKINGDLQMNGFALLASAYLGLIDSISTRSGNGLVYRVGTNLWYNNGNGVPVQVTSGSAVNAPGSGAISVNIISSYPYTVLPGDAQKVLIINTSVARTINLPPATTAMFFMIKDGTGGAQNNKISVVPDGSDTIDGVNSTYLIDYNSGSIGFVSDGVTSWYAV